MSSPVRNNTARNRFELEAEGSTAIADYRSAPGVLTFYHTEVPPALRGRGIASQLIQGALEQVQAQGLKVVPTCSFVALYIKRHPEFQDMLA